MRTWLELAVPLLLGCAAVEATAQKPAREITVVVNALPPPAKPVRAASVSLWYLDSGVKITEARQVTNSDGQAQIEVSADAAQRGDLRIDITGASGLAIYQPAGGQFVTGFSPSVTSVTVSLLPVGNPALLGPAQIQAYLNRSLMQVTGLEKQVSGLKAEAAQTQSQEQYLAAELDEFAKAMGFSADQVNEQVQIWAQNVQLQADQATAEQKALAEFALKDYAAAARDFNQAGDATQKQIEADEAAAGAAEKVAEAAVDKARDGLRQLIDQREQAAGADQLRLQYHEATQAAESALTEAEAEHKKHADDAGFHDLWLDAVWDTANARVREGEIAPADQSLVLLAEAGSNFQTLAHEYTTSGDRGQVAAAESNLGVALIREGERVEGDKGMALLSESVEAYQSALAVSTKADQPQDWSMMENNLGVALDDEGQRATGDKALALLEEAVAAYHKSLEVRTKADLPHDWATTQNNLANALRDEGLDATGDKAMVLLDEAIDAFGKALEIFTKSDYPVDWAATQMNLGNTLDDEGTRASGDKAMGLLGRAVESDREALEVYTKGDMPQYWAMAQNVLGTALDNEGESAKGDQALAFLDQAVTAYRAALEVRTESDLPRDWANTENNLGVALRDEGLRVTGDKAMALLDEAAQAFRKALEVRSKANEPQLWADTQESLAFALRSEGERASGDAATALFEQAVAAYESALEVEQNDEDLLDTTGAVYHDRLFRFDRALELDERLVGVDPSAANRTELMEGALTAARFDVCLEQAGPLSDSATTAPLIPVRDALELACQWGSGNKSGALAAEGALKKDAAEGKKADWNFAGTLHFLSESPAFAKGRAAWVALFTAIENDDAAGMTAALGQLEGVVGG